MSEIEAVATPPTLPNQVQEWEAVIWDEVLPIVMLSWSATVERRSGSVRTPKEYAAYVLRFVKEHGPDPRIVTSGMVEAFAYGAGPSGEAPSASTVTVRLSALRSWFDFLRRHKVRPDNPVDDVPRPRASAPVPRGLTNDELVRLIEAMPEQKRDGSLNPRGLRDRAIVITAVLTGLRRTEVLSLTRGQIDTRGDVPYYRVRVKGGQERHRELPRPALEAMARYWASRGIAFDDLPDDARVFDITGSGFAMSLTRAAQRAGIPIVRVHDLRHSSAKLRRDGGASLEHVQHHLGHANLATTARYLARLEGSRDDGWSGPAAALGLTGEK